MRRGWGAGSGILLTAAVLVLLAITLPMAVQAQNETNTTPVPVIASIAPAETTLAPANETPAGITPAPTITELPVATTIAATTTETTEPLPYITETHPPPVVVLDEPDINDLTATIYGIATPGYVNATIQSIRWEWGDNESPEYHEFPYSHVYSSPGTYVLSVTATQSDGQNATATEAITVTHLPPTETIPETLNITSPPPLSVTPDHPPVLTLLEPVVDGLNVTINGNLNPGFPGAEILSVSVDWDDGNVSSSPDLPVTHGYSEPGIYTITITGTQSDGLSVTKRITLDLKQTTTHPTGTPVPPPPSNNPPLLLIVIVTVVVVVIIGAVARRVSRWRGGGLPLPDIPNSASVQEEIYYQAKERGDMVTAAASATICARMFRSLADEVPEKRKFYSGIADVWEKNAREAGRMAGIEHYPLQPSSKAPVLPSMSELSAICSGTDVAPEVLDSVLRLAVEIAREGREGQAVGTSFVIGDSGSVLEHSRQSVLNPFHGHHEKERQISDAGLRGNIKEFAQLDGAFVITGSGVVEAAGRLITVDTSGVRIPGGLGSRHISVAGITLATASIGVVVSQSGGQITVFRNGRIVSSINS
jgi:DNA integrity scanning protein DisA with diadenylate cyclase activity